MEIPIAAGGIGVGVAIAIVVIAMVLSRTRRPDVMKLTQSPLPAASSPPDRDPFIQGSATDKRQTPRRTGNPVRVLITEIGRSSSPREAWVADRSLGGLCLRTREAILEGTKLRVCAADSSSKARVEVKVRSCNKGQSGWMVGCQFVVAPAADILWEFG